MTSRAVVIDTNVGIAANSNADVSHACELRCVQRLREITEQGHLVLDAEGQIFAEYLRHLSLAGEPGVGDAFMRWINDHQHDPKFCTLISLTIKPNGEIVEFPSQQSLGGFDPSDKKFVAVAVAHPDNPPIQVALDRDGCATETLWLTSELRLSSFAQTTSAINRPASAPTDP